MTPAVWKSSAGQRGGLGVLSSGQCNVEQGGCIGSRENTVAVAVVQRPGLDHSKFRAQGNRQQDRPSYVYLDLGQPRPACASCGRPRETEQWNGFNGC